MRFGAVALCVLVAACGDDGGTPSDAAPDDAVVDSVPDANLLMPATLAETGLCDDAGCQTINAGILEYKPRYELFSMLAVAATHGMGVALIPPLLIEAELASGELVVACNRPLRGERGYYLISPAQPAQSPVLAAFSGWLQGMVAAGGGPVRDES